MLSKLFGKRRPKISADIIARSLWNDMVEPPERLGSWRPDIICDRRFQERSKLYRVAVVLGSLELARHDRPKFADVAREFEPFFFPPTRDDGVLTVIREAMSDIAKLVDPTTERRELSWSRHWLAEAGFEVVNPVDLTIHTLAWMSFWVAVNKTLAEVEPV